MKKNIIKIIFLLSTIVFSFIFAFNFLAFNLESWTWLFFTTIVLSILSQLFNLSKFKIGKKLLFVILGILLTFITFLISFIIPGHLFVYSPELDISTLTTVVGFMFTILNFTLLYTILTIFINKLKINDKNKSSYIKLIGIYFSIVTIIETIILISINKP